MKLWYDCGQFPRSVNVISLTENELVIEENNRIKRVSPSLIGSLYFYDPYSCPSFRRAAGIEVAEPAPVIEATEDEEDLDEPLSEEEEKQRIIEYLKKRKVQYLVHFTRKENLRSINNNGILPRASVPENYTDNFNDDERLDGNVDCSCFTFSFPNYRMLYLLRQKYSDTTYVVLLIDINCLNDFSLEDMLFFKTNAASNAVFGLPSKGLQAVKAMFKDNEDHVRANYNLPEHYTTDPQAEVQLRGKVKPEYIKFVFPDPNKEPGASGQGYFRGRKDYEYWQS